MNFIKIQHIKNKRKTQHFHEKKKNRPIEKNKYNIKLFHSNTGYKKINFFTLELKKKNFNLKL